MAIANTSYVRQAEKPSDLAPQGFEISRRVMFQRVALLSQQRDG